MNDTVSATPKKMSVKTIAVIGVLTAVTCILAPLSIPIGDVPISLTNLVIYFGLYILGTRRETVSYIVYLLIGLVGVPVFSGFTGLHLLGLCRNVEFRCELKAYIASLGDSHRKWRY